MSVDKKVKAVERNGQYVPALVSAESGKVLKLFKDHADESEEAVEKALSNKAIVYLAWSDGEEDVDALHELVDKAVKRRTVRGWCNRWSRGKGLPKIAKTK